MHILNTKDEVNLIPFIEGTQEFNYIHCESCKQTTKKIVGGKNRCQEIVLKKHIHVHLKSDGIHVWVNYYGQCGNAGVKEIDGKSYCIIHAEKILIKKLGDENEY